MHLHTTIASMERKVWFNSPVLRTLFLITSFVTTLSHGGDVKDHARAKEEATIFETFEVDGLVIDCIDVYKQPAFEHPLLINHTIQMKPTHYHERMSVDDQLVGASHPWKLPKSCPKGSIPIRRSQSNNGYSRDNPSASDWHNNIPRHDPLQQPRGMQDKKNDPSGNHEVSDIYFRLANNVYGGNASISVWNPTVETSAELSASLIWLSSIDKKTHLQAGWLVYPALNGDGQTRFFIAWTTNGYTALCYNVQCPGFVHTNPHTILDAHLQPVSVYGGPPYGIEVAILKDKASGNWWVHLQGAEMGYWPKELVPSLANGADVLSFAGEVYNSRPGGRHTGTQMGSGHFSGEGFRKASFFRNVHILDNTYRYVYPFPGDGWVDVGHPNCYDLRGMGRHEEVGVWGFYFFYGGPGRSANCP